MRSAGRGRLWILAFSTGRHIFSHCFERRTSFQRFPTQTCREFPKIMRFNAAASALPKYGSTSTSTNTNNSEDDPVQTLASRQLEWQALPISEKVLLLREIKAILSGMTVQDVVERLGHDEAKLMGFDITTPEGQFEAAQSSFHYVLTVQGTVSKFLEAYEHYDKTSSCSTSSHPLQKASVQTTKTANGQEQRIVKTSPLFWADRAGPFALCKVDVWLKPDAPYQPLAIDAFLQANKDSNKDGTVEEPKNDANGCMVVLAAGNHCFLAIIDVLHGLFQCNRVVYLKHSPVRNHHDGMVRHVLQPLINRGYFNAELSTTVERAQQIVYHNSVAHVHLTGGKTVHDAIVWGNPSSSIESRTIPVLKAKMTSELGCITPWIIAPNQRWTRRQLRHQAEHLFASLYHNAGANCNSPKVLVLPKDWKHATEFVRLVQELMQAHDLPVSYYPGAKQRWTAFRQAYPKENVAQEFGNDSSEAFAERKLLPSAADCVLPWLVIDLEVDLSTEQGRAAAKAEYAFANEPFAPVLTIVRISDNSLSTAVNFCNDYLFGSLSCTLVAPKRRTTEVSEAIAQLRYGSICVNCWSGLDYLALCGTWGAFPGESLQNVQSGIGQVHNVYFVRDIQKTVIYSRIIDPLLHLKRKSHRRSLRENLVLADWILHPRVYSLVNMGLVVATGRSLP